jgi:hypothetical protein
MPGHSRPKDGVLSHAYVPGINVLLPASFLKTWMAGTSPAMTKFAVAQIASASSDNCRGLASRPDWSVSGVG